MLTPIVLSAALGTAGVFGALALLSARMYRRLPTASHVALDGVTTTIDAVAACRRSGRSGWKLVAYAQSLVAGKFTCSRLNTWDTPACAIERGRGYCEQQALAHKAIYDTLGIQTRPVFALRCAFPPEMVDGTWWPGGISDHACPRVCIGDDERDVRPGSIEYTPSLPSSVFSLGFIHGLPGYARPRMRDLLSRTCVAISRRRRQAQ
jgi:hypothetical protein